MTQALIRGWTKHLTPPVPGWQRTDPLDRGLVGEWRFDENTGLILPDYGGRGWHATVIGAIWVSTEYGPALRFDGVNDYAHTVDLQNWVTAQTPVTFEAFVNITETSGDWNARGLIGWRATVAVGNKHCGLAWTDAVNLLSLLICAGNTDVTSTVVIAAGWHHFVGTYDGTTQYLYVDSILKDSDAQAGVLDAYDFGGKEQELHIGQSQPGLLELGCDIALARLYDRHLTAAEVRARYEICLKRAQPLTHVWMMPWGRAPVAPPVGGHMTLWGRYWGP